MPRVFISYQRSDEPLAQRVRERLAAAGFPTWMDQYDIPAGAYWPDEIDRGLAASEVVVGILTPDAIDSRNVKNEWDWAISNGRRLILLQARACVVPHRYVSINYIDASADIERALLALLRTLGIDDHPPRDQLVERRADDSPATFAPTVPLPREEPRVAGRERERATIDAALAALREGTGGVLLVAGQAGIGKTTLTRWLGWRASANGALVLSGGCFDLTTTPPYGPWLDVVAGWTAGEARESLPTALRDRSAFTSAVSQLALFESIAAALSDAAGKRMLVVILEDLHWADQASLDLLRYLARTLAALPVLFVVSYRDNEFARGYPLGQLLPALVRETHARRIALAPLDAAATRELVAARCALDTDATTRLVVWIQQLAEGNPFFASELLHTLEQAGVLASDGDGWRLHDLEHVQVPALIRQVIEARLEGLGDDARRVLELAAVIGHDVPVDLWVEVSGSDESLLADALEQASDARIIEETPGGERFRFTHALIRQSLYESLVSLRRRGWHRKVAEALEATVSPDPDTIAHHYLHAKDLRAAHWLLLAGERAQRAYAWVTAVERFGAALPLLETHPERDGERCALLVRIAHLSSTFAPREATSWCEQAEELATRLSDDVLVAAARQIRGLLLYYSSDLPAAMRWLESAAEIGRTLAPHDLVRLIQLTSTPANIDTAEVDAGALAHVIESLGLRGAIEAGSALHGIRTRTGRFEETERVARACIALYEHGREHGIPERLLLYFAFGGWNMLGYLYQPLGRPDEARDAWRAAGELARQIGDQYLVTAALNEELQYVALPFETDRLDERLRLASAIQHEHGRARGSLAVGESTWLAEERFLRGDWDEAREIASSGIASRSTLGAALFTCRIVLATIAGYQGRDEEAHAWLAQLEPVTPDQPPGEDMFLRAIRVQQLQAELALADGDLHIARAWIAALDHWLDWSGAVFGRAQAACLWSSVHLRAAEPDYALSCARDAVTLASEPHQPLALLAAKRALGAALAAHGEFSDALKHLDAASALGVACDAPWERALTLVARAEVAHAMGEWDSAAIDEARSIGQRLAARPLLARIDDLTTAHVASIER